MTAVCPGCEQFRKQPHLGGEIGLNRRMIIHVIAAEVRERRRRQLHAVKPMLIEAMRRRFEREVRDAFVARGLRALRAASPDQASSAIRKRRPTA